MSNLRIVLHPLQRLHLLSNSGSHIRLRLFRLRHRRAEVINLLRSFGRVLKRRRELLHSSHHAFTAASLLGRHGGRAAPSSLVFLSLLRLARRYAKACGRVVAFVVVKVVSVVRREARYIVVIVGDIKRSSSELPCGYGAREYVK